jgi:inorganic pyrophosphatase
MAGQPPTPPVRLSDLSAVSPESGALNVIVDTPKDSRNKYKYDEPLGLFELRHVLPVGASFPFDFGFVPSTRGEDGDPLDVLVLMDEPAFVGCLVPARLLGVIEAEQTEEGKTMRNDRLIAVAALSQTHKEVRSLDQLSPTLLGEIEHFFVSYNAQRGRQFKPLGRHGPGRAEALIEEGMQTYRRGAKKKPHKAGKR